MWKSFLSLGKEFGKSCIINTLALSKPTYVASILNSPENDFIKKIQRLIYNFIWDKTERIKRNTLIGNVLKGGLAVVDIECKIKALKASWVPRLLKNKNILYKIFDSYCKQINIDVNYALQFSEKKIENMQKLGKLPMFYQQVLCSFNECKPKNSENISSIKIVQQPIWNNCNFLYKGNSLFFKNWITCGILYVNDLLNDEGNFKSLLDFKDCINNKSNWICEFKILSSVFKPLCRKFDFSNCKFTNIQNNNYFNFHSGYENVLGQRCSFFYENLVNKKFTKPCYQTVLQKEYDIDSVDWKYIYKCKLSDISDKRLAEFNYKVLNNILCNNVYLSKWNKEIHSQCKICQENENTKHLIFECDNVLEIWNALNVYTKIDIKWKHVLLGFFHEQNRKIVSLNTLISFIAYRIYKYKMYCRVHSLEETNYNILNHVKVSTVFYASVLKSHNSFVDYRIFQNFVKSI